MHFRVHQRISAAFTIVLLIGLAVKIHGDEKLAQPSVLPRLLNPELRVVNSNETGSGGDASQQLSQRLLKHAVSGDETKAWKILGDIADTEQSTGVRISTPATSAGVAALHRELIQLAADDRYELLLKWTMPDADHKSVRCFQVLTTDDSPPQEFARAMNERPAARSFSTPSAAGMPGLFSSGWLLMEAADEVGQLDALRRKLQTLKDSEIPGADLCLYLSEIKAAVNTDAFLSSARERLRTLKSNAGIAIESEKVQAESLLPSLANRAVVLEDYLLAVVGLNHGELRVDAVESLIALEDLLRTNGGDRLTRTHVQRAALFGLTLPVNLNVDANFLKVTSDAAPKHWISFGVDDGTRWTLNNVAAPTRPVWISHEEHLKHISGRDIDFLCFRYPLVGDFQFAVDAQISGPDDMASGITANGLAIRISGYQSGPLLTVTSPDKRDQIEQPCPFIVHQRAPQFHQLSMMFEDGASTLLVNNQRMWTEKRSELLPRNVRGGAETTENSVDTSDAEAGSSPWIGLRSSAEYSPMFRNLRITGSPRIPRKLLLSQEGLRGWISSWYGESRESVWPLQNKQQANSNAMPDWSISDGIISRAPRSENDTTSTRASRLHYFRPLQDGESISYEFFQDESPAIHPALGRMAFVISPGGVNQTWIVDGQLEWTGLAQDNSIANPLARRGPRDLPLNSNNWNKVMVAIRDDVATISLNDTTIYQQKIDAVHSRQFGFFAQPNVQPIQIRNVVLTGDWPETIPEEILQNLVAPATTPSNEQSQALTRALGDHFLAENVDSVRRHAKTLENEQRFQFLSEWVLPSAQRNSYRLNGHFSPLSPAPPVAEYTPEETRRLAEAEQSGQGRILVGGSLFSAAFDLIQLARELNRLDELQKRVMQDELARSSQDLFDHAHRSRLAMLILIAIAQEQWETANSSLLELGEIVRSHPIRDPAERWPEMLVFWESVRHPETSANASEPLFQFVFRDLHGGSGTGSDLWDRQLLALMGFRKISDGTNISAEDYYRTLPVKQWAAAEFDSALNRGPGMPGSRWMFENHGLSQLAGHENDFLYFQSPLRGDFNIDGLTTTFDWRECEMFFNGRWAGPAWGMTHYETGDHRRSYSKPTLSKKMSTEVGHWFHIRIESKDGTGRILANGRELYSEELQTDHDPWIGARFWHRYHGGIRDVRITGTPEIPEKLNLLHDPELTGWASYYEQRNFSRLESWEFDGEQLMGMRVQTPGVSSSESLLRYHRPMLEDGTIEYEFYYAPNEQLVHPALDRLAFLLEPDGVKIHWCTDAAFDRTGLSPDNAFEEPQNRPTLNALPFQVNEWNRVKLQLTGNEVQLFLNDEIVYRRKLEASNMRRFGLFHFSEQTGVRVRHMTWKGEWPKELPGLKDQELADIEFIESLDQAKETMQSQELEFSDRKPIPTDFRVSLDASQGAISLFQPESQGLQAVQESKKQTGYQIQAIAAPQTLVGDFDVTAEYERLEIESPVNKEEFSGINLTAKFDSAPAVRVYFHARRSHSGLVFLDTMTEQPLDEGGSRWNVQGFGQETASGKLRLARRGKTLYFLFANGDSDQFRLYRTHEVSDSPVIGNSLELQTVTAAMGRTSTIWKSLTIHADQLK